jgi:hypothetical protein
LGFHQTENMKLGVNIKMLSPKLSKSYYIMQSPKGITSLSILISMHFLHFHSHLKYRLSFVGEDGGVMGKVKKKLGLEKKVVRLISNVEKVTSCSNLLKY